MCVSIYIKMINHISIEFNSTILVKPWLHGCCFLLSFFLLLFFFFLFFFFKSCGVQLSVSCTSEYSIAPKHQAAWNELECEMRQMLMTSGCSRFLFLCWGHLTNSVQQSCAYWPRTTQIVGFQPIKGDFYPSCGGEQWQRKPGNPRKLRHQKTKVGRVR